VLYATWKEGVVRFHIIKQNNAIEKFLALMNSDKFVNPETRRKLFSEIKEE